MKQSIEKRIKDLENNTVVVNHEIIRLIQSGITYDQLSDGQKDDYCKYQGIEREAFEEFNLMMLDTTDVSLQLKPPPMTPEEERRHVAEVAKEIEAYLNQDLEE